MTTPRRSLLRCSPGQKLDVPGLSEFIRQAVRLQILHHASEQTIDGGGILAELRRLGYQVSTGALEAMLRRMHDQGLLDSRAEIVDGDFRRVYAMTDVGRAALAAERQALADLAGVVLAHRDQRGMPDMGQRR